MDFDWGKLIFMAVGSLGLGASGLHFVRGWMPRLMLSGLLCGLFLYSGIGATSQSVDSFFVPCYFAFFVAVIFGYLFGLAFFYRAGNVVATRLPPIMSKFERVLGWKLLPFIYLLIFAFPLIWPEFRLHLLLTPPNPDLTTIFYARFDGDPDKLTRMVGYLQLLLTPFFYLAIYRYRTRLHWVVMLLLGMLYVQYVSDAYIARGAVLLNAVLYAGAVWMLRPRWRAILLIAMIAVIPLMFFWLHLYASIRLGAVAEEVGYMDAIYEVLKIELNFIKDAGMPVFASGAHVDLASYFKWIATLPLPKLLTGAIEGARINEEISEIVLGRPVGSTGWYVVLPGLVSESIYIYGLKFFWLHGIFVGALAGVIIRLVGYVPQFMFLSLHSVLLFAYVLNRAGISALLPDVANTYLLFYMFLFFVVFGRSCANMSKRGIRTTLGYGN